MQKFINILALSFIFSFLSITVNAQVNLVATGYGNNTLAYSSDGVSWTGLGTSIFSSSGNGAAWNGSKWMATGTGGNSLAYSYDGVNWTGLGYSVFSGNGNKIAWGGNRWVATGFGNAGSIAYSNDGNYWVGLGNNIFAAGSGIAWNGTIWVATGSGNNSLAYSYNGITWVGLGNNIFSQSGADVAWNGTMWIATGTGGNSLAYSYDGISWTGLGTGMFSGGATDVSWNGTTWLATGNGNNTLAYSSDGVVWSGLGTGVLTNGYSVAWSGTLWMVGGYGGNSLSVAYTVLDDWYGLGNNVFSMCFDIAKKQDWNPPTIVCPNSQSIIATSGISAPLPDYRSQATVSDDSTPRPYIVLVQSPLAGAFVSGTSSVTLTATDRSGKSSNCSFPVTVSVPLPLSGGVISPSALTISPATYPGTILNSAVANGGSPGYNYQWQISTNNGSSWVDISGAIGAMYSPSILYQTAWFRRKVTDSSANIAYSNTSVISVTLSGCWINPAALTITTGTSPGAIQSYSGATGGSGGYIYQWQCSTNNGSSWVDVSGASGISYNSPALAQTTWFRLKVTDSSNTVVYSNTSVITVPLAGGLISPTNQTIDIGVTPGIIVSSTGASGGTEGYVYQWQKSVDNGSTWIDVADASNSLYAPTTLLSTTLFRRRVTDGSNNIAYSNSVIVTVPLSGGVIESSIQTISAGTTPGIIQNSLSASGGQGVYSYAWFSSIDNGVTWSGIGGITTAYFDSPILQRNTLYKRRVFDGLNMVYSNVVAIKVSLSPGVISPAIKTINLGQYTGEILNETVASGGCDGYVYQWQKSTNNGSSWVDVLGANAISLPQDMPFINTWYRRRVSDSSGDFAYTDPAKINVAIFGGTISPSAITISPGAQAGTFSSDGAGVYGGTGVYLYQWQCSIDNGISWADISGADSTVYFSASFSQTTWIRRRVTDSSNTFAYSNTSVITVPFSGGSIFPDLLTIDPGTSPVVISSGNDASGGAGGYFYEWQNSTDSCSTWTSIPGTNIASYSTSDLSQITYFRRKVTDNSNHVAYSDTSKVIVTLKGGNISPSAITISSGSSIGTISNSVAAGGGTGIYNYSWRRSTDGGNTWTWIINSSDLSYTPPVHTNTTWYVRGVTDNVGHRSKSNISKVIVPLSGGVITPSSQTYQVGTSWVTISNLVEASGGTEQHVYQWQSSIDGGSTWIDLPNSNLMSYTMPTISTQTTWFRRKATDNTNVVDFSNISKITVVGGGTIKPYELTIDAGTSPGLISNDRAAFGCAGELTYQWQWSTDYGDSWIDIPLANGLDFISPALAKSTLFRRKMTDSNNNVAYSTTSVITVNPVYFPLTGGEIYPSEQTISMSTLPAKLSNFILASGGTGELNYKWEKSIDNGLSWDLVLYANNAFYSPSVIVQPTWFRRVVMDDNGIKAYSNISKVLLTSYSGLTGGSIYPFFQVIDEGSSPGTIIHNSAGGGSVGGYVYQWQRSTNEGGTWEDISGANSISFTVPVLSQSTWFRRKITDGNGKNEYSNESKVLVTPVFSGGTISPVTKMIATGTSPGTITSELSASGGTGNYLYNWMFSTNNGGFWEGISGTNGDSYTPPILNQTTWYKREANDVYGRFRYSNTVIINVGVIPPLVGGTIIPSFTSVLGATPTITCSDATGGTGGYSYQWESSVNSGNSWVTVSSSISYLSPALSQTIWFRRKVTDSAGTSIYSGTMEVTVLMPFALFAGTISPVLQTVTMGNSPQTILCSDASGGSEVYEFQWEKSTNNGLNWSNIDGVTGNSYVPPCVNAWYRRLVKDSNNTVVYSDLSKITVIAPPTLFGGVISPASKTINAGVSPGVISCSDATGGIGGYTFQWESSINKGLSWTPVTNATSYNSPELTQTSWFRRRVADLNSVTAYSNTLLVNVVLVGGTVNSSLQTINAGESFNSIDCTLANGGTGGYSYQWEKSIDNGATWVDIPDSKNSALSGAALKKTTKFRRRVTDNSGSTAYSDIAVVAVVLTGGTITTQALSVIPGESPGKFYCSIGARGGLGNYLYQWRYSTNKGSSWIDILNASDSTFVAPELTQETWFQRKVVDNSVVAYSNTIKISIKLMGGVISPESIVVSPGYIPGIFNCTPASGGEGSYSYQWQKCLASDLTWSDISDANQASYSPPALTQRTSFRRKVTDSNNNVSYSNIAYVKMDNSRIDDSTPYIEPPVATSTNSTSVGSIAGSADVSASGGATYQIPISIAPGTAGIQPELSVVYNSQSGDGMLGLGFNLSGLSAISRVPKNLYYEGESGAVSFTNNDRFALDGSHLIATTGIYGADETVYNLESNNAMRITSYGTLGNGPLWFKVETKEGKTIEYGNTADSRILSSNGTVISWKISRIYDTNKNYLVYKYNENDDEKPVKEILYTGNSNEGKDPYNAVRFSYQNKTDAVKSYINGQAFVSNLLLKSVEVESENSLVRKYLFEYSLDCLSHLTKVTETGAGGETLNPTIIEWGKDTTIIRVHKIIDPPSVSQIGSNNLLQINAACDVNGDGLCDIISVYDFKEVHGDGKLYDMQGAQVFNSRLDSNGQVTFNQGYLYKQTGSFFHNNATLVNSGLVFGDMYGKGVVDIIAPRYDNANGPYAVFEILNREKSARYQLKTTEEIPAYTVDDFNNNGRSEIILFEKSVNSDGFYPGAIFESPDGDLNTEFSPREIKLKISGTPLYLFSGDYNSDGKADLCIVTAWGVYVYSFFDDIFVLKSSYSFKSSDDRYVLFNLKLARQGDFNKDGIPDILLIGDNDKSVKIAYSNGNSRFAVRDLGVDIKGIDDESGHDNSEDNCMVADFNNDGNADFILFDSRYQYEKHLIGSNYVFKEFVTSWYQSTPTGFVKVKEQISTNSEDALNKYYVSGDFNGDGRFDLINYGYDCYTGSSSEKKWRMYNTFDPEFKLQKVVAVTDGLNQKTRFNYRPLSFSTLADGTDFYTKGSSSIANVIHLQSAMPVVRSLVSPDGLGGTNKTEYSYKYAKAHLGGKGFLGFGEITSSNVLGKKQVTNYYLINTTYFIPELKKTTVTTSEDEAISTTEVSVSYKSLGNKRFIVESNESKYTDHLKSNSVKNSSVFDDYGNVLKTTVDYGIGVGSVVTDNIYTSEGSYCNSRLSESTVTRKIGSEPSDVRKFKYTYDNLGRLTGKITDPLKAKALTETYTDFDRWGNAKTIVLSAAGLKNRATTFEYDKYGRFVEKETNALHHSKEYHYDGRFGQVLSEKTADGLMTTYEYDGFGNKKRTVLADGRTVQYEYAWLNGTPTNGVYAIKTSTTGEPYSKVYFDGFGRELRTETPSFSGTTYADKQYNPDGSLNKESLPYFEGDLANAKWTSYTYDKFGRVTKKTFIDKETSYFYDLIDGKYRLGITDPAGVSSYKFMDALGNLVKAHDNGGDIVYTYFSSGQVKTIISNDATTEMHYDEYGRQDYLIDPDAGRTDYEYNAFGELVKQKDAESHEYTMAYDLLGRLDSKSCNGKVTKNTYIDDLGSNGLGQVLSVSTLQDNVSTTYSYDGLGRTTKVSENVQGQVFDTEYTYNSTGKVEQQLFPSASGQRFAISNEYDANGYLKKVKKADGTTIWEMLEANALGQLKQSKSGMALTTVKTYDPVYGMLKSIQTGSIQNNEYDFNPSTGNLTYRMDRTIPVGTGFMTEHFDYDNLNRLTTVKLNNVETQVLNYQTNGNIDNTSKLGNYYYHPAKVHAINGVDDPNSTIVNAPQNITYTSFNKVASITEGDKNLQYLYGTDQQRRRTVYSNGTLQKTTYFIGSYEREICNGVTKERHYISGGDGVAAVYIKTNGNGQLYYLLSDHLGSIQYICNESGQKLETLNFDAWGRRRNPTDWTYTGITTSAYLTRGFTGHEHLDDFGLIDMNGRVYDPILGRFLSPDPYVQLPDFSQNLNRYSYCFNNPLKFTDPDGEWIHIVIGAVVGGVINWGTHGFKFNRDGLVAFGIGAGAGVLTALTGGAAFIAAGGTAVGGGGFLAGAISSGVGYTVGTAFQSLGNAVYFGDPMPSGEEFLTGLGTSMLTGGVTQGVNALMHGRTFLKGTLPTTVGKPVPVRLPVNVPDPKIQLPNGGRSQLADMPTDVYRSAEVQNNLSLVRVNTGGENYSYIKPAAVSGSYRLQFESGKYYVGKGLEPRMMQSIQRIESTGDKLIKDGAKFFPASSTKEAFINEYNMMKEIGQPSHWDANTLLYNVIWSPGKRLMGE